MSGFAFSITCASCGASVSELAANTFEFMNKQRSAGWDVPHALDNKPIRCPKCTQPTTNPTLPEQAPPTS